MLKPSLRVHSCQVGERVTGQIDWRYSVSELWADGLIHGFGIGFLVAGVMLLFSARPGLSAAEQEAATTYLVTLTASITLSAAYNTWPVSPFKWQLRRWDHAAIFLLIAGTYTPFLLRLNAWGSLASIWAAATVGVTVKLVWPGRFDALSIVLYLLLGWSAVALYGEMRDGLPLGSLGLIIVGGLAYSAGVIFHLWRRLPFHNAIWHSFVLVAAVCHYGAVWLMLGGAGSAGIR